MSGAVLVIDSFTVGRIEIGSDMPPPPQMRELFPCPSVISSRCVRGSGGNYWHLSLPRGSGDLGYSVDAWEDLAGFEVSAYFGFRSHGYDIMAYDSFVLDFTRVLGRGVLEVSVDGQDVEVPIRISGPIRIPLEAFENTGEFNDVAGVRFAFRPATSRFSFTLAEISLVPEPSPFLLTLASGCALACRRRRPAVLN